MYESPTIHPEASVNAAPLVRTYGRKSISLSCRSRSTRTATPVTEVSRPPEKSYDIADPRYIEDLPQWRAGAQGRDTQDSQGNVRPTRPKRRWQVYADAHPGHLAGARAGHGSP